MKSKEYFEIKKDSILNILKYVLYFGIFYLFYNAKILNIYSPTFYGFFLAMLFLNENFIYMSLIYFLAVCVSNVNTFSLIYALICCIAGSIIALTHRKLKKRIPTYMAILYGVIIGLFYLYFNFKDLSTIYINVIDIFLNSIFMLCCINFFVITKNRKYNFNLNVDEIVCGCLVLTMIFCGLNNINFYAFDLVKLFGFLVVLGSTAVLPGAFGIILGIVAGLGVFICSGSLQYITLFSISSLVAYIFKNQNKIYLSLSIVLVDICLSLFLNLFGLVNVFTFLPTTCASLVFLLIPKTIIKKAKSNLFLTNEYDSLKNILNQNKLQTSKKLLFTAEVFYEMDKSFRKLVKGKIDNKTAKTMICSELIRENCESCPNKSRCLKGFNSELKKVFEGLVNAGFEKGKITLVDFPSYLTTRCIKLNKLVNSLNSLLNDYKKYAKMNIDLDSSKLLIADQLRGVSHILTELSSQAQEVVNIDHSFEKQIRENLIYNDIVPSEVVCFEKDEKTVIVSLIIRSIDFDNEKILKVLNSYCPSKMVLDEILPCPDNNLTYLSYKTAPTYDMAVGVAKTTKAGSENSGDSHSMVKLPSGKFILAICDGMGSGEKASQKSETSINLIENFYRAGFDDETILSSVNKLLNLTSENIFSALDISVVDLKNGEVDFIKQGATIGFIKQGENITKIESNSLPLGILENVSPKVTKTVLSPDDLVVMLSDGVVDAVGEDNLQEYLKFLPSKSPQEIADNILNKARKIQKDYPSDDMTVLVGKIFYSCA